jgi:hypothetical protein
MESPKAAVRGVAGGPALVDDREVGGVDVVVGRDLVAVLSGSGRVLVEQRLRPIPPATPRRHRRPLADAGLA